jgi:YD repeat-containing protein
MAYYEYDSRWNDHRCIGYQYIELADSPCDESNPYHSCFVPDPPLSCPPGYLGSQPYCISTSSGDGDNLGNSPNSTCKPINISTGNKFFQTTDYQDKHFLFAHSYNSVTSSWRFSYQQRLLINPTYFVVAERIDGKGIHFTNDNGVYISSTQRREKLTFDGTNYVLTFPDNSVETYDVNGRLLEIMSPNDLPVTLSYLNSTVTLTKGNAQLTYTFGTNNEVTQATFPDGSSISYNYQTISGQPLLETLSNTQGIIRRYFYEDTRFPTYITGIENENGNRISSVIYDDQGRAISSEAGPLNSGIERTQIQYNADGTRTLTNALGKQNIYHFTQFNGEYKMTQVEGIASDNCAAANKNYTYDANGFMESKTDWKGNTTTYIHNDRGQELSRVEASGTPHAHTITTEWHAEFNLPIKIIESARETIMAYDANGRLLSRNITER